MRRKIPSTTALISFEAAARHESFTKAAQELSLTQGAICRQIASLEEFLSVELFRRSRRGVKLTEAGLSYSRRVATQLDAVERDTLSVMGQQGANVIELAVVPTFGTQWLLPRLKDFQQKHPEVTVNLTNRTRPFLFADTDFDAAIYFGDADWSGTESHRLMGENPMPVCSPNLTGEKDKPVSRRNRRIAPAAADHSPLCLAPVVQLAKPKCPARHDRTALRAILHACPSGHARYGNSADSTVPDSTRTGREAPGHCQRPGVIKHQGVLLDDSRAKGRIGLFKGISRLASQSGTELQPRRIKALHY